MNSTFKGKQGEECAAAFLIKQGYKVLKRNFRYREGEIDIIAEKDDCLIFAEVKTWDAFSEEDIGYAVTEDKMKRIISTARYFLMQYADYTEKQLQFDLIFITGNFTRIKHIQNAFSEV